jgi:hypothetical protein
MAHLKINKYRAWDRQKVIYTNGIFDELIIEAGSAPQFDKQ